MRYCINNRTSTPLLSNHNAVAHIITTNCTVNHQHRTIRCGICITCEDVALLIPLGETRRAMVKNHCVLRTT